MASPAFRAFLPHRLCDGSLGGEGVLYLYDMTFLVLLSIFEISPTIVHPDLFVQGAKLH